jgi:hypothetical protein
LGNQCANEPEKQKKKEKKRHSTKSNAVTIKVPEDASKSRPLVSERCPLKVQCSGLAQHKRKESEEKR